MARRLLVGRLQTVRAHTSLSFSRQFAQLNKFNLVFLTCASTAGPWANLPVDEMRSGIFSFVRLSSQQSADSCRASRSSPSKFINETKWSILFIVCFDVAAQPLSACRALFSNVHTFSSSFASQPCSHSLTFAEYSLCSVSARAHTHTNDLIEFK